MSKDGNEEDLRFNDSERVVDDSTGELGWALWHWGFALGTSSSGGEHIILG